MTEQMKKAMEEGRARGAGPDGIPGGPVGPPDQNAILAQQMAAMLRMSESGRAALPPSDIHDHFEMGQRMVVAGLEAQLRSMADRIRKTDDSAAREKMTADFKELIGKASEARKKQRDRQIELLEKRLAELKAQKDETPEAIAERLLQGDPKPQPAEAEKKE